MKKEKKAVRTFPSLAWRITIIVLALWLGCMSILTLSVASDMLHQAENKLQFYLDSSTSRAKHDDTDLPGTMEWNLIDELGWPYYWINFKKLLPFVADQHFSYSLSSKDWMWGKWDLYYGYEVALIYYDENDQELIRTGDYLTFEYTTPENWANKDITPLGKGYVYLNDIPGGEERFNDLITDYPGGDLGLWMFMPLFRLTGWFEGNEFRPTLIESGSHISYSGKTTDTAQLADLDSRGYVEWNTMLTCEAPEGQPLTTIYAMNPSGYNCTQTPVTTNGQHFDTLIDLLRTDRNSERPMSLEKRNLSESVIISYRKHTDKYGAFSVAAALRCRPIQYALLRLLWVYIGSFAILILLLWAMLRKIRKELTRPLEEMAGAARDGYTISPASGWSEPAQLEAHFMQTHQTLAENKTEIQQLRTALAFARDAEENRKQLISNITHELKTPLAIVHSYAECLQDGVAPEKREQYLQTILEETERMDAMVVQMLDLSRLEAGRVRLSSDRFSLLELSKSIAEKLSPMLDAKKLTLKFGLAQEFLITADEGRIGQVITNLLSNALKYTGEGGTIEIRVYLTGGKAYFYVENTASHLSKDALEKVWESFYRADPSRNTPGTGLGLALVKSIITLHGGTCSVRNTATEQGTSAVEFGFILPLL